MAYCSTSSLVRCCDPNPNQVSSWRNFAEAVVVVAGVVASLRLCGNSAPANNAPCTSVSGPRCFDGVFPVVAASMLGELLLSVAKYGAIFLKGEWPAFEDEAIGGACL